jgi:imidazolonepropionase-like amidohydrolase
MIKILRTAHPLKLVVSIAAPALLAAGLLGCQPRPPEIAQVPFEPDSGNLFIRCGALIDGLSDDVLHDRMVIIRDGRFDTIAAGDTKVPEPMALLDLSDKTCLPGLINMHVHLLERAIDAVDYGVYFRNDEKVFNARVLEAAAMALLSGFTTVRNVGDYLTEPIVFGRDQIIAGQAIGPRIQNGGPYLTIPGGGGEVPAVDYDPADIPAAARKGVAKGPDEFREKARAAVAEGADFLKVIASGAVFAFGTEPGAPEMTQQEIEAVVEVAHAAGIKVTAHVHSAQSGMDAILAGVDSLEHASLLTDEVIELAAERGVAFSMDVYNGTYTENVGHELGYPEEIMQRNTDTTEAQRVVFEKAYARGVTLLYGTDASVHPHDMSGWQFAVMVERGMRPMDAIRSATSVAAEHMGWAKDIGAVEAGRFGDLIAVSGNPLDDMLLMRDVDVVVKGGLVFKNQE